MKLYIRPDSESPCRAVVTESFFTTFAPGNESQCALEFGYIEVLAPEGEQPDGHVCQAVKADGAWTTEWVSLASVHAELEAKTRASSIRRARDAALARTDWTQAKDIPDSVSSLWTGYRQALRDITDQAGFPFDVQWPRPPQ